RSRSRIAEFEREAPDTYVLTAGPTLQRNKTAIRSSKPLSDESFGKIILMRVPPANPSPRLSRRRVCSGRSLRAALGLAGACSSALLLSAAGFSQSRSHRATGRPASDEFTREISPMVQKFCVPCHQGKSAPNG